MLFYCKKFIAQFLMPMPMICEFFVIGLVLQHLTKYKKIGIAFKCCALILFLMAGYGVGRSYLYRLERAYPPFEPTSAQCQTLQGARVVVLGQGLPSESDLPLRLRESPLFMARLFEGFRVAKKIPESCLIVSMGGKGALVDKWSYLQSYADVFTFPTNRIKLIDGACDTSDEARKLKSLLVTQHQTQGENNVFVKSPNDIILVSSASHLARAVRIFIREGFHPILSPCDYTEREPVRVKCEWYAWPFPSWENFRQSHMATRELLGNFFERMKKSY